MRYREIIAEAPQIIGDIDWNLTNRRDNLARANALMKLNPTILQTYPAAKLVQHAGNVGGQFGLVSTMTGLLEYYVHYEINNLPSLGKCATQVKLWRSRTATVSNLAKLVFDQYLLGSFDTVVSDSHQTQRGREFWEVQISGHSHTKSVGLLDNNTIKLYDRKMSMSDWLNSVDGWGQNPSYSRLRFFISNLSL